MSTPVNFSTLTSITSAGSNDQLLVRLDNSLSGASGFGKITTSYFLSTINTNIGNLSTTIQTNSSTWVTTITSTSANNYILSINDSYRTIIDTASSTTTYSVPPCSTAAFTIGTQIIIIQGNKSASNYTLLSAGNGVTINSYNSSLSLAGNYAASTLINTATDTWYLIGNLA